MSSIDDRLRSLHLGRKVFATIAVVDVVITGLEIFWWHSIFFTPPLAGLILMAVMFGIWTRRIGRLERELHRPDYALIASMEREVYGETFRHDGAPQASALGTRHYPINSAAAVLAKGYVGRNHCAACKQMAQRYRWQ